MQSKTISNQTFDVYELKYLYLNIFLKYLVFQILFKYMYIYYPRLG